nr:mitochondrial acidic protein mam33 [Ipomoea batatas]
MTRVTTVLRRARKAIQDFDLLKALQSEINHELSNPAPFQNEERGSLGDFSIDWDSPNSQDVLLRRRFESGEEVAVSAILGADAGTEDRLPREALVKVCIKKPGLSSILQFDCRGFGDYRVPNFEIDNAYYIASTSGLDSSAYKGPSFSFPSSLDPTLQTEFLRYLQARGIEENLISFLVLHLHKKEQGQYVNWLHRLQAMAAQDE